MLLDVLLDSDAWMLKFALEFASAIASRGLDVGSIVGADDGGMVGVGDGAVVGRSDGVTVGICDDWYTEKYTLELIEAWVSEIALACDSDVRETDEKTLYETAPVVACQVSLTISNPWSRLMRRTFGVIIVGDEVCVDGAAESVPGT